MKHLTKLIPAAALVLMALGCQREQVVKETPSPLYDPETKEVTTEFVLNVTSAPSTKMSADVVQLNENFRGISDAHLFIYNTGMTDWTGYAGYPYVLNTSATPSKEFDLGLFFSKNGLDNSGNDNSPASSTDPYHDNTTNNNYTGNNAVASRRVLQLSLPVGADAIMFYGKATKPENAAEADYGATNYLLTTNTVISGTPSETVIGGKPILNASNTSSYDHTGNLMILVINTILNASVSGNGSVTVGDHVYSSLPAVSWADYGHRYEYDKLGDDSRYSADDSSIKHTLKGLEEVIGQSYYLFTYIRPSGVPSNLVVGSDDWKTWVANHAQEYSATGEYRAGSSAAIKSMVIDTYKVISAANSADPTDANEANAKRMAERILDISDDFFYQTDSPTPGQWYAGDYKSYSTIQNYFVPDRIAEETWTANYSLAYQDLNKYPFESFGIPEGAAQLGFVKKGTVNYPDNCSKKGAVRPNANIDEFVYLHPNKPLVNPTMESFEPRKYMYPAELWYYVNSPIRTTSKDVTISSYPDGIQNWNADASWSADNWQFPGTVEGSSRGVAVAHSINYGVALFQTAVQYTATALEDNRAKITSNKEKNKTIYINNANLQLRGVLIGGVNPRMNWQFVRKFTSGDYAAFDGVIYDHSIPAGASLVPANIQQKTEPNYTLVYDNYNSNGDGLLANQNDVFVALEFVNGGEAFYGRDNLIPHNGVFYLVAKLPKPTTNSISDSKWPTDHQIPPVFGVNDNQAAIVELGATAGKSKKIARVFIQDFMTSATFKINESSLQHAYYSVPDLRAAQMSLGLSVDLQWTQGIDYDDVKL